MRKTSLLALALLAAMPFAASASNHGDAHADGLSYTYVEGGYQHVNSALDADGLYLRGSYEFGDSGFSIQGAYSDSSTEDFNIDPRVSEIGLGYHYSFTQRVDGLVEVAYRNIDTNFGDADGSRAAIGVRAKLGDNWEGLAKVNHYDGGEFDSDTTGTLGVQYRFTQTWGAIGEVEFADGDEIYQFGVRATF